MAIERQTDFEPSDDSMAEESETVEIPISMLAGQTVAPGDVVRLEVVSSNDDSGTITVKYAMPSKSGGGIKEAVAAFEE